jgi:hypothetical protein
MTIGGRGGAQVEVMLGGSVVGAQRRPRLAAVA